jgi:hypothetical protein
VVLDARWDRAKLVTLAALINKVTPLLKPGVHEGSLKLMSKGSSIDASVLRIFDITDHYLCAKGNYQLGQINETEWVVFDSDDIGKSWGRAEQTGTLMECLEYIQQRHSYEGGVYEDDDCC